MEFYCPSTLLKVDVDNTHPIAYGMEDSAAVMFNDSPVFTLNPDKEKSTAREPSLSISKWWPAIPRAIRL